MTTGQRIQQARKKVGLSQKQLGEKLGLSASMIGQWENDLRNPKHETLKRIAKALNVHILSLIDWDTIPTAPPDAVEPSLEELEEMERKELRPRLLSYYDELNFDGQQKAVERVAELTEIPRYRRQDPAQPPAEATPGQDTPAAQDAPEGDEKPE